MEGDWGGVFRDEEDTNDGRSRQLARQLAEAVNQDVPRAPQVSFIVRIDGVKYVVIVQKMGGS